MSVFYRAVVENNNDPLKVGRVQVRIYGLHSKNKTRTGRDGIPTEHLPWAEPCLPVAEGSISGYGIFAVPLQGSHVMVFFEDDNIEKPIYFGSLPGISSERAKNEGFYDPSGKYPDKLGSDFHPKAKSKYPHNMVIAVHGGHYIELDSTPGSKRIKVYHNSGTYTEINNDGKEVINIVNDQEVTITGDKTDVVGGNLTITVTGNVLLTSPSTTITGGTVALANQATQQTLMNETAATRYNNHTHPESGGGTTSAPNQQMNTNHLTANTTAS